MWPAGGCDTWAAATPRNNASSRGLKERGAARQPIPQDVYLFCTVPRPCSTAAGRLAGRCARQRPLALEALLAGAEDVLPPLLEKQASCKTRYRRCKGASGVMCRGPANTVDAAAAAVAECWQTGTTASRFKSFALCALHILSLYAFERFNKQPRSFCSLGQQLRLHSPVLLLQKPPGAPSPMHTQRHFRPSQVPNLQSLQDGREEQHPGMRAIFQRINMRRSREAELYTSRSWLSHPRSPAHLTNVEHAFTPAAMSVGVLHPSCAAIALAGTGCAIHASSCAADGQTGQARPLVICASWAHYHTAALPLQYLYLL